MFSMFILLPLALHVRGLISMLLLLLLKCTIATNGKSRDIHGEALDETMTFIKKSMTSFRFQGQMFLLMQSAEWSATLSLWFSNKKNVLETAELNNRSHPCCNPA